MINENVTVAKTGGYESRPSNVILTSTTLS